jgi:hypothetical protein
MRLRRDMMLGVSDSRERPPFDPCLVKVIDDDLC